MMPLASAAALTREEAQALLAAADRDTAGARHRTPAVVALLLYCGLRVSELCEADVGQLAHERGHRVLRFVGKGDQPRLVPLPYAVTRRLARTAAGTAVRSTNGSAQRPLEVVAVHLGAALHVVHVLGGRDQLPALPADPVEVRDRRVAVRGHVGARPVRGVPDERHVEVAALPLIAADQQRVLPRNHPSIIYGRLSRRKHGW
ncbi:hypothetical protein E1258_05395 [Micromonospora sp. KC207]|nr:hypothetical protein E1258_05395 [Micromonospora sp. KC207]